MKALVTVAIPTYQRAGQIGRAIESVLAQDYEPVELIISDNASSDATPEVCGAYVRRHPSIRYVRQDSNLGPTPNFEALRGLSAGEYFLFLGDDDWIDPGYISACVAAIEANPGTSLVAGRSFYHALDGVKAEPYPINTSDPDPCRRVLTFCRQVGANGVFYGVMPARFARRAPSIRNVMGNDLVHVMGLAYLGPVMTLEEIAVHRSVGGTTSSLANVAATLRLGWFQANAPQIAIAYWIFQDIAVHSPLYADLGRGRRFRLGLHAGGIVLWRFVPAAVLKFARIHCRAVRRRGARGAAAKKAL